jgi:hypothetical protein
MSKENEADFQAATQCWCYEGEFDKPKNAKVRNHCHILGHYIGAAHQSCNLHMKPWITPIPVVVHNLKGYDSHLMILEAAKVSGRITCIPNNSEKYISFSIGQLRFLDSFQFMSSSLDKLVEATDTVDFKITKSCFL